MGRERQVDQHMWHDLWNKTWRDRSGNIVIWQMPNVWLLGWAVLTVISLFLHGGAGTIVSVIAHMVLGIWAALEIFKGVNYFRRAVGLVIAFFVIASLLKNF